MKLLFSSFYHVSLAGFFFFLKTYLNSSNFFLKKLKPIADAYTHAIDFSQRALQTKRSEKRKWLGISDVMVWVFVQVFMKGEGADGGSLKVKLLDPHLQVCYYYFLVTSARIV